MAAETPSKGVCRCGRSKLAYDTHIICVKCRMDKYEKICSRSHHCEECPINAPEKFWDGYRKSALYHMDNNLDDERYRFYLTSRDGGILLAPTSRKGLRKNRQQTRDRVARDLSDGEAIDTVESREEEGFESTRVTYSQQYNDDSVNADDLTGEQMAYEAARTLQSPDLNVSMVEAEAAPLTMREALQLPDAEMRAFLEAEVRRQEAANRPSGSTPKKTSHTRTTATFNVPDQVTLEEAQEAAAAAATIVIKDSGESRDATPPPAVKPRRPLNSASTSRQRTRAGDCEAGSSSGQRSVNTRARSSGKKYSGGVGTAPLPPKLPDPIEHIEGMSLEGVDEEMVPPSPPASPPRQRTPSPEGPDVAAGRPVPSPRAHYGTARVVTVSGKAVTLKIRSPTPTTHSATNTPLSIKREKGEEKPPVKQETDTHIIIDQEVNASQVEELTTAAISHPAPSPRQTHELRQPKPEELVDPGEWARSMLKDKAAEGASNTKTVVSEITKVEIPVKGESSITPVQSAKRDRDNGEGAVSTSPQVYKRSKFIVRTPTPVAESPRAIMSPPPRQYQESPAREPQLPFQSNLTHIHAYTRANMITVPRQRNHPIRIQTRQIPELCPELMDIINRMKSNARQFENPNHDVGYLNNMPEMLGDMEAPAGPYDDYLLDPRGNATAPLGSMHVSKASPIWARNAQMSPATINPEAIRENNADYRLLVRMLSMNLHHLKAADARARDIGDPILVPLLDGAISSWRHMAHMVVYGLLNSEFQLRNHILAACNLEDGERRHLRHQGVLCDQAFDIPNRAAQAGSTNQVVVVPQQPARAVTPSFD